jgi:hypothetical protein
VCESTRALLRALHQCRSACFDKCVGLLRRAYGSDFPGDRFSSMLSTLRRQLFFEAASLLGAARALSTSAVASHGGLQDKDRIFTNIYGVHDKFIDGAMKRGDWYRCGPRWLATAMWPRLLRVSALVEVVDEDGWHAVVLSGHVLATHALRWLGHAAHCALWCAGRRTW